MAAKTVSAGVIVTDGNSVLLGHVTGSRYWDIPKGRVDLGETNLDGAVRELHEETSMRVSPESLVELGIFRYKKNKDLALWLYHVENMPDIKTLDCLSTFDAGNGITKKEFDAFGVVKWKDARKMVVPDMWKVLTDARTKINVDAA